MISHLPRFRTGQDKIVLITAKKIGLPKHNLHTYTISDPVLPLQKEMLVCNLQIKSLPSNWHQIYLVSFLDFVLSIFQLKFFLFSYLPWSL